MKRRTLLRTMALGTLAAPFTAPLAAASSTQSNTSSGTNPGASGASASMSSAPPTQHATPKALDHQDIQTGIEAFAQLAPDTAVNLIIQDPTSQHVFSHQADKQLFVGSAVKTFILAQFLKEVETGQLSEETQFSIGPDTWSPGSLVFQHLQGTTTGRSVLEAMIQHSDNTATDIAINAVGAEKVRALIHEAGLTKTQIPDSTRKLFSYLAGAPSGTDIGWQGMQDLEKDIYPGEVRHAVNLEQSMLSTAREMSRWYEHVLSGKVFSKTETLAEFKRVSFNTKMVPADTLAYGKGGSIDWEGFHCFCLAGQMLQHERTTSFCFIINWEGPNEDVPQVFERFLEKGSQVLARIDG